MFVVFLLILGVTVAVMPHVATLTQLFVLAGINGFAIGSFDTAINVWILEIWAEDSGPFMQALHFTYGIGSFVAPLICEPFLSTESIHSGSHGIPHSIEAIPTTVVSSTPSSIIPSTLLPSEGISSITTATPLILLSELVNQTMFESINASTDTTLPPIDPIDFLIYIPYGIAGATTVISGLVVLVLYYYKKYEPPVNPNKCQKEIHKVKCIEDGKYI